MFNRKYFRPAIMLLVVCFVTHIQCKKNPTTFQVDDLKRPVIWINAFEMIFSTSTASGNPAPQTLQVKNTGADTINYNIESDASWINIANPSGSSNDELKEHTVSVNISGLEAKDDAYTAVITIECTEAYNNPQKINVSLKISKEPPPRISIDLKRLSFSAQKGGANPALQSVSLQNTGGGTLDFQAVPDSAWISVNPTSGKVNENQKTLKISVNAANLSAGTHKGKIDIIDSAAVNSPQTITITLKISEDPPPQIKVSPNKISFQAITGGQNPPSEHLWISNIGGSVLIYTLDWDVDWITISPNSGRSNGPEKRHTIVADILGLPSGTHTGTITVTDPNSTNSPKSILVSLTLSNTPAPPTDNKVGISCIPSSGTTGTTVSISIDVHGNTSELKVFGLDLIFDPAMFQFQSVTKGNLTSSWAAVAGNEISSGTIKIGGFLGSGSGIPIGSSGNIAIITLTVTGSSYSNGQQSQLSITSFSDDIISMIPSPSIVTFTLNK